MSPQTQSPRTPAPRTPVVSLRWLFSWGLLLAAVGSLVVVPARVAYADAWKSAAAEFKLAIVSKDPDQILEALTAITRFDSKASAKLVAENALLHDDLDVHEESFEYLTRLKDEPARDYLIEQARKAKKWEMRSQCARVIASFPSSFTRNVLEELATGDKRWNVRSSAVRALAHIRHESSVQFLIDRLRDEKTPRARWDIVAALKSLTGLDFEDDYKQWTQWYVRVKDEYKLPTKQELMEAQHGKGAQDLATAVAQGLYGPIFSERVVFVFDISGSMSRGTDLQGTRLDIAKRELKKALENVSSKGYFNIVAFAEKITAHKRRLQRAKPKNLLKGIDFVEELSAGGETNIYGALREAFADPDMDTIYLLSDGEPTIGEVGKFGRMIGDNVTQLQRLVRSWNRDRMVVINCIGFFPGEGKNEDKSVAKEFLRKLAKENHGFYKEIY